MDLAEHDALHGAERPKVSTAAAWQRARALHPAGTPLVRMIDLDAGMQVFQPIPKTQFNFFDGATIIRPSIPGGHSLAQWQDILADYDARFLEVTT